MLHAYSPSTLGGSGRRIIQVKITSLHTPWKFSKILSQKWKKSWGSSSIQRSCIQSQISKKNFFPLFFGITWNLQICLGRRDILTVLYWLFQGMIVNYFSIVSSLSLTDCSRILQFVMFKSYTQFAKFTLVSFLMAVINKIIFLKQSLILNFDFLSVDRQNRNAIHFYVLALALLNSLGGSDHFLVGSLGFLFVHNHMCKYSLSLLF